VDEYGNVGNEVQKTVGDVAAAFIVARYKAGIVVVQTANLPVD
jgi:hypothetical protein